MDSTMLAGCLAIRQGINGITHIVEGNDFPCPEHEEFTKRIAAGLPERMRAFETELIGVLVDLAWAVQECSCDTCAEIEAAIKVEQQRANAQNN